MLGLNKNIYYLILQRLLVTDPKDPEKYATVRVARIGYRTMITRACHAKKHKSKKLLNEALDLVFTREELAKSTGMGLRKEKRKEQEQQGQQENQKPLDGLRVEAIFGKSLLISNNGQSV